MNTNPKAIKVLCYGDSNTWGRFPVTSDRYPVDVRWTGVLQLKLGNEYWVIEEGLRSRTTNLDDPNPTKKGRNGKTYLLSCLESQNPMDIVLLMLGTNDLKSQFKRSVKEIAGGIDELITVIEDHSRTSRGDHPKVILVSPARVREASLDSDDMFAGAEAKSGKLAPEYKKIADARGATFVDVAKHVEPDEGEGIHFSPESHSTLAKVFEKAVRSVAKEI